MDGTPDCTDGCDFDATKIAPGLCGCGTPDTDSDMDGTPDCTDGCDFDATKTGPGVCGCGVPDTNMDGDTLADCQDNCPGVTNQDQADSDMDGTGDACEVACLEGDIDPKGVGDGDRDLIDYIVGRRTLLGILASHPRDADCGDLHPGSITCDQAVGADNWCVTGDNDFDLNDLIILRRLLLGVLQLSCVTCDGRTADGAADLRLPGDIAPTSGADGLVDVADVVRAFRFAVGLDVADAEMRLRADVAPAVIDDGVATVVGNARVDVADAVLLLRASVGLTQLAWPVRALDVRLEDAMPYVAFTAAVSGWPAWARCEAADADGLAGGGFDAAGDRCGVLAVTDPVDRFGPGLLARLSYRAPEPVDAASLRLEVSVARSDLTLARPSASLSSAP
jgi:hypothetical protein